MEKELMELLIKERLKYNNLREEYIQYASLITEILECTDIEKMKELNNRLQAFVLTSLLVYP